MSPSSHPDRPAKSPPHHRRLSALLAWLGRPLYAHPDPSSRRERLLAWLLLSLLVLTLATLVLVLAVNPAASPRRMEYLGLILGLDVLVVLAYLLNCAGHYRTAAGLIVTAAVLGPWGSLALDPTVLQGDFVPLAYSLVSILLSSILLPPLVTGLLALAQLAALALIPNVSPVTAEINWPSFLTLIFFTSVLSLLSNVISQSDREQIDRQTQQLERSEARLRRLSVHDHLTRLFNRRYLEGTLRREIQRAERTGSPIGVILIDIDHFKLVNDRHGHAAGDAFLKQLAQLALASIRRGDVACRYGGEEFVLILPEAAQDVTRARAERLRVAVRQLQVEHNGQPLGQVTISVGVAGYPRHGTDSDALLQAADAALYRAKELGRDRVVAAD